MARPFLPSIFDGLTSSELFALLSDIPEQGPRPVGPPAVPQVPAPAHPVGPPDVPQAPTPVRPVGPPDAPQVPAPASPEGAQPSASPSEPSLRVLEGEEWQSFLTHRGPSRVVRRDRPQPSQSHHPYQRPQLSQPPLILCPRQRPPSQRPPFLPPGHPTPVQYFAALPQTSLQQRLDRAYPFKRECLRRIFRSLSEALDSPLPVRAVPGQPGLAHHPYFCPYHQMMGHALEDCLHFKEWLKKAVTEGAVVLPAAYLQDPVSSPESCASNSVATSGGWPPSDDI